MSVPSLGTGKRLFLGALACLFFGAAGGWVAHQKFSADPQAARLERQLATAQADIYRWQELASTTLPRIMTDATASSRDHFLDIGFGYDRPDIDHNTMLSTYYFSPFIDAQGKLVPGNCGLYFETVTASMPFGWRLREFGENVLIGKISVFTVPASLSHNPTPAQIWKELNAAYPGGINPQCNPGYKA